ncbi:MAG: hypothetical protein HQ582_23210 [Planctomycetes bacterium]|nr:hypothetical protein [Planctomycetota bacterium]
MYLPTMADCRAANSAGRSTIKRHLDRLRQALKTWMEETDDEGVSVAELMAD